MAASTGSEDPIVTLFELTDKVSEKSPKLRRIYLYTATVIVVLLGIIVYLIYVALRGSLWFASLGLAAVVLGGAALVLLAETDRFYRAFSERHRRLRMLQFTEPSPKIPAGPTPLRRLVRHLALTNPRVASVLSERPGALRFTMRRTRNGAAVEVGFAISVPQSPGYRWLRLGDPGFVIVARIGPDALTLAQLQHSGEEAQAAARQLRGRLARAIVLRQHPTPISDEVYEHAVRHPLPMPGGPAVALEVITEREDGTYDLIPQVTGVP
ncbi:MAG: hypothetical protein L3K15_09485 [Thermoplasmata archaeon]|nr:hypothetical protein [Thermoplasmata archaeon]